MAMNIIFLSDDKFSDVFAVALESLYSQQIHTQDLRVFLVENKISEQNKASFDSIAQSFGRQIEYIPMPDVQTRTGASLYIPTRLNIVDYARLLLAEILPAEIDKIIQLDCDLIVRQPLDELWEMDLKDNYCGMINEGHNKQMRRVLHIPEDGNYYNSGVVLINLKKWREEDIEQKCMEYMRKMNGYIPINAQGVMNAVMDGKIACIPLKFNVFPHMYAFTYEEFLKLRKPRYYYTKTEYEDALKDPVIVHFMTCFYLDVRPWMKGCEHPMAGEYLEYRRKTPYAQMPLWEYKPKPMRRFYIKLCHTLPKPLAIRMSSLIYSYVLPAKHSAMEKIRKLSLGGRYAF